MYGDNVTRQLMEIQSEQRAQKTASMLSYGQLTKPANTPSKSWSGVVANAPSGATVAARFVATFTRTDGVEAPPFVDFPWDFTLAKWNYDDFIESLPSVTNITGRDRHAVDEVRWSEGVYEIGSNYVKWRIDIDAESWWYMSSNGTTVNLIVQAVSMVQGELTLERVI